MAVFNSRRIEAALLEAGLITEKQLSSVLNEHKKSGKRIGRLLMEKGFISEDKLLTVMEEELNIPQVNLNHFRINPADAKSIPAEMAFRHRVIPIANKDGQVTLAMADPLDLAAVDDVAMITGAEVNPVAARESIINYLLTQLYSIEEYPDQNVPASGTLKPGGRSSEHTPRHPRLQVEDAPAVRVVNSLIERAIEEGASDIHLEPSDEKLRIRMRLDGVLHDLTAPPKHTQANIISRVKIMANLDIAERRLPQDGNIEWKGARDGISLRVSTLPTIYGEKVVIRLLEKEKIILPLEKLGFSKNNYQTFLRLLLNQYGLVLVTGPTGCGKTTTLYSALHYLNQPHENIITVEDPVEYRLKGINQVQVNPRINRNFANALRSILRQDPNIIMVGEIRDIETAKITTQAAFTGHLVLSTLHTNNAAGAVTRLIDMGLAEYLVTASLMGVVAQRLVRKICSHCIDEHLLSDKEKYLYQHFFHKEPPRKLMRGVKCKRCNNTGYRGRTAIHEILVLSEDQQELILKKPTAEMLQKKAVEQGMIPLVQDGLRCVETGLTTVNEIVRTTFNSTYDPMASEDAGRIAEMSSLYRSKH